MNLIHFGMNKFVCFIFHLVKATFAEVTDKPQMAFLLGKFSKQVSSYFVAFYLPFPSFPFGSMFTK